MNGASNDGTMAYDEAGSVDNRLSLTPSQFPFTKDWTDGSTYTLTVQVRQISPGEFEVVKADSQGAPGEEEPGNQEQPTGEQQEAAGAEGGGEEEAPGNYPNPAVAKMMQKG
jgi:hypothetical protein